MYMALKPVTKKNTLSALLALAITSVAVPSGLKGLDYVRGLSEAPNTEIRTGMLNGSRDGRLYITFPDAGKQKFEVAVPYDPFFLKVDEPITVEIGPNRSNGKPVITNILDFTPDYELRPSGFPHLIY